MKIGYLMQAGVPDPRKSPFTGPAIHVRQVIKELQLLGHDVRLIARIEGQIWKSDDLEQFQQITVQKMDQGLLRFIESVIRRIQYELKLPYLTLFESLRFAWACCLELGDYDLLYERLGWVAYGGLIASQRLKIPLLLEVNGNDLAVMDTLGNSPRGIQRRLEIASMRWVIRNAEHFVACADNARNQFIRNWNIDPHKVTTIYNGTELVELLQRDQLNAYNTDNPNRITSIAYVGGFYPWQGVEILIRAVAQVIEQGKELKVVLCGFGPGLDKAKKLVSESNLSSYMFFTGQLSSQDLAQFLADVDIGVSPYCNWEEYTGMKLLDYKAAGLAIIASGKNGDPSVIRHEQTGWIVPPCDENALAEAILMLSTDINLRRRMGKEARFEAEQVHSWRHTAKNLEQLFYQIVDK